MRAGSSRTIWRYFGPSDKSGHAPQSSEDALPFPRIGCTPSRVAVAWRRALAIAVWACPSGSAATPTTVTTSTPMITASDRPVLISTTSDRLAIVDERHVVLVQACRISFTPMKPRIAARP